jgi:hypothetical protein
MGVGDLVENQYKDIVAFIFRAPPLKAGDKFFQRNIPRRAEEFPRFQRDSPVAGRKPVKLVRTHTVHPDTVFPRQADKAAGAGSGFRHKQGPLRTARPDTFLNRVKTRQITHAQLLLFE